MSQLAFARLPPVIRGWILGSDTGPIANAYVQLLEERGYARSTINDYLGGVGHFFHWLACEAVSIDELDERLIGLFLDQHLPNCDCASSCRRGRRSMQAALMRLLELLRASGCIEPRASTSSAAINRELQDFEHYLTEICGLAPATCYTRSRRVRAFLLEQFGTGPLRWNAVKRQHIASFMLQHTASWATSSKQAFGSSLRSYLRFKALSGARVAALSAAIPRTAQWRLASVPRSLSMAELAQFLRCFDRRSSTGMRDYAMARCCADLGLRASEIARLRLNDVNWREGTLTIAGKGRRIDLLPLPKATGQAIAEYLRGGRPTTISRALFMRHRPPLHRSVTAGSVRNAIRYAAQRSGLADRIDGSHVLRHTIAQRLVHSGASLKQIADLLRHRCLDTTTIYTKIDLRNLARVALPWLGRSV
jgi:site-specific recombinase XerD